MSYSNFSTPGSRSTGTQPLTNDQLVRMAPSIFAQQPWERMSDRYTFIPTIQIVEKMRAEGFAPFAATQSRTRIEGKQDFTKHMIRFRDVRQNEPAIRTLGTIYPELVLTNAHDGGSAYKLDAGLFRLVCLNGMVVCDSTINQMNVRHTGSADGIIEASYEIVEQFPRVLESVEQFSQLRLSAGQREAFGKAALELRYDESDVAPVSVQQVVQPRRTADSDPTLWNTFNVVQEHLVQGGLRGRNVETRRRLKTRAVTGISENTRLNKALWTLTSEMQKLMN